MQTTVARTRALLTENDREVLAGEKGDQNRRRNVKWEVQSRIEDEFPSDVGLLREHCPDLLDELQAVVCDDEDDVATDGGAPEAARDHLARGLEDLPPSVPGRTAVEDALAELDRED